MMLLPLLAASSMIRPPMHRAWTVVAGEETVVQAVRGGVMYYSATKGAGAIRLATGKPLWTQKFSEWSPDADIGDKTLFVLAGREKSTDVLAFDLGTGKERLGERLTAEIREIACDKDRVFVLLPKYELQAYDARTGKIAW